MKAQNYGRIVNISSVWSKIAKTGRASYCASKAGIASMTRAIAVELAPYNILLNTVAPGFTDTDLTRQNNTAEQIQEISSHIPMRRMAKPVEVAELIYFLCSDKNTYITGQEIFIDGGLTSVWPV